MNLLENAYYPGFRLVIYKIVNLVITVDQCASISRVVFLFAKKLHYIFIVRNLTYWDRGLDIDRLRLRRRDGAKGLDLAIIEVRRLAKVRESDRGRRDAVKLRKRHNGILPPVDAEYGRNKNGCGCTHLVSFLNTDARERRILKYAPIQKFHDIESSTNHSCVFAQAVCLRDRHICALQGVDDAEFALDLVSCLGKQLARWFLS